MMIQEHLGSSQKPKILISKEEVMSLVEDKSPSQILTSIIHNIQKCHIDEQAFEFLFRKLYPFIQRIVQFPKLKNNLDIEKLNLFTKAVSCIEFSFNTFLEYFSDEDISSLFELLGICEERLKDPIQKLLEGIFTKFEESLPLYKEIISNRFLLFSPLLHDQNELEFNFKIILLMLQGKKFGNDILEFYAQFIQPRIVFCSLENIELARDIIEAVCSTCPECQRATLRYMSKVYLKVGSSEQIKILELASKVIHTNFFFQSNSFLEWDFCEIINLAAKSESYIVADAVIEMIDDSAVRKFIQNNIRTVLPKIFDNLYRLSKKFWRQEQRFKAIKVIGNILNINNEVFETCVIEYNKKKHVQNQINREDW